MQVFYAGAKVVQRPLVVLDQFYNNSLIPDTRDIDLVLLYGLRTFWERDFRLGLPFVLVPPFVETVTPTADLPIPAHLRSAPWVTVIAYQQEILERGVALAAQARRSEVVIITVSHAPDEARGVLDKAGISSNRSVTLPLQSDATVFGLMGASRVAIISNGFLQIMEALAMACPVICLPRGVGITSFNIDERFGRYVSIDESEHRQRDRLIHWLAETPFSSAMRAALATERGGLRRCADLIEEVSRHDA